MRLALVIASQCSKQPPLDGLESVAQSLAAQLFDASLGQCFPDRDAGPLLNGTVEATKSAIRAALRQASNDSAVLVIAFLGHGIVRQNNLFLLPTDADPIAPTADSAVHLVQIIKEECGNHSGLAGLVLLLDCCGAGMALFAAGQEWLDDLGGKLPFDLISSTDSGLAYNARFTSELSRLIATGFDDDIEYVKARDYFPKLKEALKSEQAPRTISYGATNALYLSRNANANAPWWRTTHSELLRRSLAHFQPTGYLRQLAELLESNRLIAVRGPSGSGKSTLVAALAHPFLSRDIIPAPRISALIPLTRNQRFHDVLSMLEEQLSRSTSSEPQPQRAGRTDLEAALMATLRARDADEPVRLIFDAIDQLDAISYDRLSKFIADLTAPPAWRGTVIVTTVDTRTVPTAASVLEIGPPTGAEISAYLAGRGFTLEVPSTPNSLGGSWLGTKFIGDQLTRGAAIDDAVAASIETIYAHDLALTGFLESHQYRSLLAGLASTGAGPSVRLSVVEHFLRMVAAPDPTSNLRRLDNICVRGRRFVDSEILVGFEHDLFAKFVESRTTPADLYQWHSTLAELPLDGPNAARERVSHILALAKLTASITPDDDARIRGPESWVEDLVHLLDDIWDPTDDHYYWTDVAERLGELDTDAGGEDYALTIHSARTRAAVYAILALLFGRYTMDSDRWKVLPVLYVIPDSDPAVGKAIEEFRNRLYGDWSEYSERREIGSLIECLAEPRLTARYRMLYLQANVDHADNVDVARQLIALIADCIARFGSADPAVHTAVSLLVDQTYQMGPWQLKEIYRELSEPPVGDYLEYRREQISDMLEQRRKDGSDYY